MPSIHFRSLATLLYALALLSCSGGDATGPGSEDVVVGSINVALPRATIHPGDSVQATATVLSTTSSVISGRPVTWSSNNNSVVSVSQNGVVKAVSIGSATVSASADGKSGLATINVTVIPLRGIVFSPDTVSVFVGQATALAIVVQDSAGNTVTDRQISWTSSDTTRAKVTATGLVTALAAGTVDIVASVEGKSAIARVKVLPVVSNSPVASVSVSIPRTALRVGESLQAAALVLDSLGGVLTGRNITWQSSNTDVVTVSPGGLVTSVGPGIASVTAESEGRTGQIVLQISLVPISTVTVSPANQIVSSGASLGLTVILKDSAERTLSGRSISWSSSAPNIASVNNEGVVSGLLVGNATITATAEGKQGNATITVSALNTPVNSITLSPDNANMSGGATKKLTPTLRDVNGNILTDRSISWSSSNPDRATVSSSGVVAASQVNAGVVISATVEGKTATASIGIVTFARMTSGAGFTCALTSDGTPYCWGTNSVGQLGDGTTTLRSLPTKVATDLKFVTIASGVSHSCGIATNGLSYCWGDNTAGQLGDGTRTRRLSPVPVNGNYAFTSVAPGSQNTCATTGNGSVLCWGVIRSTDVYGSVYSQSQTSPVQIGSGMVAVVAGLDGRYCSVDAAALAYCWNLEYTYPYSGPAIPPIRGPVSTSLAFTTVRVGYGHVCGLARTGQAYCWGANSVGQLGNGTTVASTTPILVSGGLLFQTLAVGGTTEEVCTDATCSASYQAGFSCGLTLAGKAYCWGASAIAGASATTPQAIQGSLTFTGLRGGSNHVCGLAAESGAAYCWGKNATGQLGTGAFEAATDPAYVFGN